MTSAKAYVKLAEEANGPIPRPVDFAYIWGDALPELARRSPDLRIINLETSRPQRRESGVMLLSPGPIERSTGFEIMVR